MSRFRLIGLMSGTSMDGVDLVDASFTKTTNEQWDFSIENVQGFPYPPPLLSDLKGSFHFSAEKLLLLDKELGKYFATCIQQFISDNNLENIRFDAISSHGHTIFHQPNIGFTYQIGCGATIASTLHIPVINDFRTKDVIHGGQGAPLVPIGDLKLFKKKADALLNIGGFVNVCFPHEKDVLAFDISPGNLPLNLLMQEHFNLPFDDRGMKARSGKVNVDLLRVLCDLDYYKQPFPKSLGTEWLKSTFLPELCIKLSPEDILCTVTEHIAIQIASTLNTFEVKKTMITGGGARNTFLLERISIFLDKASTTFVPEKQIVDYKEALIFAFLGALYLNNETNTLSSVTGASKDVIGGVLHLP